MQWWVILRLRVPVSPLWLVEKRAAKLSSQALYESKRAILKQHVKHVEAMILYHHSAEGWWVGPVRSDPRGPLPHL